MKAKLLCILLLFALAVPAFSQNIWIMLGDHEGLSYEVSLPKKSVAMSRNVFLSGENEGFYWITDWGIDCKALKIRELKIKVYTPDNELIKTEDVFGAWVSPEEGDYEKEDSFGFIALTKYWCTE